MERQFARSRSSPQKSIDMRVRGDDIDWKCDKCGCSIRAAVNAGLTHVCITSAYLTNNSNQSTSVDHQVDSNDKSSRHMKHHIIEPPWEDFGNVSEYTMDPSCHSVLTEENHSLYFSDSDSDSEEDVDVEGETIEPDTRDNIEPIILHENNNDNLLVEPVQIDNVIHEEEPEVHIESNIRPTVPEYIDAYSIEHSRQPLMAEDILEASFSGAQPSTMAGMLGTEERSSRLYSLLYGSLVCKESYLGKVEQRMVQEDCYYFEMMCNAVGVNRGRCAFPFNESNFDSEWVCVMIEEMNETMSDISSIEVTTNTMEAIDSYKEVLNQFSTGNWTLPYESRRSYEGGGSSNNAAFLTAHLLCIEASRELDRSQQLNDVGRSLGKAASLLIVALNAVRVDLAIMSAAMSRLSNYDRFRHSAGSGRVGGVGIGVKERALINYNALVSSLGKLLLIAGGRSGGDRVFELMQPVSLEMNGIFSAVFNKHEHIVMTEDVHSSELTVCYFGVDLHEMTVEKETSVEWGKLQHELFRDLCVNNSKMTHSREQLSLVLAIAHLPLHPSTLNFCGQCACVGILPFSLSQSNRDNEFAAEEFGINNEVRHVYDREAVEWWRLGANHNDADAVLSLGFMHQMGRGVEVSLDRALACFEYAVSLGSVPAMVALGSELIRPQEYVGSDQGNIRRAKGTALVQRAALVGDVDAICLTAALAMEELAQQQEKCDNSNIDESEGEYPLGGGCLDRALQAEQRLVETVERGHDNAASLLRKLRLAIFCFNDR